VTLIDIKEEIKKLLNQLKKKKKKKRKRKRKKKKKKKSILS